jgi:hypothetical protein
VLENNLGELSPQTGEVLNAISTYVQGICLQTEVNQSEVRFSRRELRGHLGLSDTGLRKHIARLVDLEYLIVHRGRRGSSYVYELVYEDEFENAVEGEFKGKVHGYDEKFAPPSHPVSTPFARGSHPLGKYGNAIKINGLESPYTKSVKNAYIPEKV